MSLFPAICVRAVSYTHLDVYKRQTYISVEPFHLFRYLDEQTFRYHHRATKDRPYTNADRFAIALTQIAGKRLTWKDLTGKEEGSF